MKRYDDPLTIEFHEEYEDIYVKARSLTEFSSIEKRLVLALALFVPILMLFQGEADIGTLTLGSIIVILLFLLTKGIRIGIGSINYLPYEAPYITRLSNGFFIWAKDSPVEVSKDMKIVKRPPDAGKPGVVYFYHGEKRDIAFLSEQEHHLDQFANYASAKYDLDIDKYIPE